ncbi:hypothetical protein II654_00965 [bacterium]|nr:hypothetical protein [bacterium]
MFPISIAIISPNIDKINKEIIMFIEVSDIVVQRMNNVNVIAAKRQIHITKPIERNKIIKKQKKAIAKHIETIINEFIL